MNSHIVCLAVLVATACTPVRVQSVTPLACPSGGLAADLATLMSRPPAQNPRALELIIPPLPIPETVKGSRALVRIVVDTAGHAIRDSVTVCGLSDSAYAVKLATVVSLTDFIPGTANARSVTAPTILVYDFTATQPGRSP